MGTGENLWVSTHFLSLFSLLSVTFLFPSQVPIWLYWWSLPNLRNAQLLQYVLFPFPVCAWIEACSISATSCCFVFSFPRRQIRRVSVPFWGSVVHFLPCLLLACLALFNSFKKFCSIRLLTWERHWVSGKISSVWTWMNPEISQLPFNCGLCCRGWLIVCIQQASEQVGANNEVHLSSSSLITL